MSQKEPRWGKGSGTPGARAAAAKAIWTISSLCKWCKWCKWCNCQVPKAVRISKRGGRRLKPTWSASQRRAVKKRFIETESKSWVKMLHYLFTKHSPESLDLMAWRKICDGSKGLKTTWYALKTRRQVALLNWSQERVVTVEHSRCEGFCTNAHFSWQVLEFHTVGYKDLQWNKALLHASWQAELRSRIRAAVCADGWSALFIHASEKWATSF